MSTIDKEKAFNISRAVYGPVKSWRFGRSLGIDPLFVDSICSFNCYYCQLGNIDQHTAVRKEYVSTEKVLKDFKTVTKDTEFDVITFSGSGEPTLASNLKDIILGLKQLTNAHQSILTNATTLLAPEVVEAVCLLDKISVKIDAGSESVFQKINRPVEGITLRLVVDGILHLKKFFKGELEVQTMFSSVNISDLDSYIELLKEIQPDLVQLNIPKRPYPDEWHRENRGNHLLEFDHKVTELKVISQIEACKIEEKIKAETGFSVQSNFSC